jgi:hypothetical protein
MGFYLGIFIFLELVTMNFFLYNDKSKKNCNILGKYSATTPTQIEETRQESHIIH